MPNFVREVAAFFMLVGIAVAVSLTNAIVLWLVDAEGALRYIEIGLVALVIGWQCDAVQAWCRRQTGATQGSSR